jgi:hypothetical protein
MTDEEIIAKYEAYMASEPYPYLNKIHRDTGLSKHVLTRLHKEGKIKLPPRLTLSGAGRMARLKGGWGDKFRLPGSPK